MRIANPIYDAVFKYLMEDTEIARQLIGKIIGEEIVELSLEPREIKAKVLLIILRINFRAVIKTKSGILKKVLIEIQKGKYPKDILRFRKYLGKGEKLTTLPIIPIYFLASPIADIPTPVMKVDRNYVDLVLEESLNEKEVFVEKLMDDGYFIQISRLNREERNELEGILNVFNQSYKLAEDERIMEVPKGVLQKYPLLNRIGERLLRAAASQEILDKMDIEEEVEDTITGYIREKEELKEVIVEKDKALEEKDKALEEKDKVLEEKDKALEEKDKVLEEKDKALEEQKVQNIKQLLQFSPLTSENIAKLNNTTTEFVEKIKREMENK